MSFLVIELQKSALDDSVTTINLLRKALVVAKKLKISKFEKWINNELNGYEDNNNIPKYRQVYGQLRALNPYRGWIPTSFGENSEMEDMASKKNVGDSISKIEYLLKTEGNTLCMSFPSEVESMLAKMFQFETKYQLFIDKSKFNRILESVRTIILNWALELECDGILGEEMIFNSEEKEIANEKNYTINNFFGDVSDSNIQQHSNHANQN